MSIAQLSPAARRDLFEIAGWIHRDDRAAARDFARGVRAALPRIGEYPQSGALRPHIDARFRFFDLRSFPYVLVVEAGRDPPRVFRILHAARDIAPLLGG